MLVRYHHTQRYKAAGWTSWWWRDVHWRCERPFRTTTRIIHFITFSWIKKKRQWWTSPISSLQDVKIIIVLFFAGEWLGLHYIVWSEECSLLLNNINFSFGNDFLYLRSLALFKHYDIPWKGLHLFCTTALDYLDYLSIYLSIYLQISMSASF